MRQNILHIIWHMDIGGAERALYQLVREQRRNGIDADVVVGGSIGLYGEKTRATGAKVISLNQKHGFDLSVGATAREILKGYSIVHFHSAEVAMIYFASHQPGLRRYYTHRGGSFAYPLKRVIRYKTIGYHFRRYFDALSGNTTQGARAASSLFKIPHEKIATTYNGIDFSLLDPKRNAEEVLSELGDRRGDVIRIGTSANLRPWKRIDLLLEAVARLPKGSVHCYIFGDGPSRGELEEQGRRLGISDALTFTGMKEHIGDYLPILDIFVLPSGPEESFGNSAVEAMGVGLPTIVFADGGGLVEHIDDGRTGYIVKDVAELTERLQGLIYDRQDRETIGAAGREAIRNKYSLEAMVARYNSLYGVRCGE